MESVFDNGDKIRYDGFIVINLSIDFSQNRKEVCTWQR